MSDDVLIHIAFPTVLFMIGLLIALGYTDPAVVASILSIPLFAFLFDVNERIRFNTDN